jgi:hypothetical protein
MKKLIFNMLLLFGITVTVAAQAIDPVPMANTPATQLENNALLYNSPINPYCTELYKSNWVWDKTSVSWVQRVELVAPCPPVPNAITPNKVPYENNNAGNVNSGTLITKPKPGGQ